MRRPMVRLGAFARKKGFELSHRADMSEDQIPDLFQQWSSRHLQSRAMARQIVRIRSRSQDENEMIGPTQWASCSCLASQSVLLAVVLGDHKTADVFAFSSFSRSVASLYQA